MFFRNQQHNPYVQLFVPFLWQKQTFSCFSGGEVKILFSIRVAIGCIAHLTASTLFQQPTIYQKPVDKQSSSLGVFNILSSEEKRYLSNTPKSVRKRDCRLAAGCCTRRWEYGSSVSRQGYAVLQVSGLVKMGISMGNGHKKDTKKMVSIEV